MKPFAIGMIQESESRLRREFQDFAVQWRQTRQQWQDEPARRFEQESLSELMPTLQRVSAATTELAEAIRRADRVVEDPDRPEGIA